MIAIGYWFSALVLLLATIIYSYFFYINKKLKYWKDQGIITPKTGLWTSLSQTYYFLNKPFHDLVMEDYKKYGRIYGGFFGNKPYLSVAEPHILKQILVKDFNKFHNRMHAKTGEPMMNNMLSVLVDKDWKRVRCIISPAFSSSRMRKMAYLVNECAEKFAKHFEKLTEDPIDCKRYMNNYTIDVIASSAFGSKLDSLNEPNNEFLVNARKLFNKDTSLLNILTYLIPRFMKLLHLDTLGDTIKYFRDFALHVIEKRNREKFRGDDFLQLMLDAQRGVLERTQEDIQEEKENGENPSSEIFHTSKTMSMEEMLAQCILFLFIGSETTSTTLAYFLYYMSLYPDCQEKLIKEIDEAWEKHEKMSFDVFSQMPYLNAVLNETLRIQPVGIVLMRECTEDCKLESTGVKLPKGTYITVPVYAMHRDPEFFPNPEEFKPERFLPENRNCIPQYAYLPFGDGPRNCLGMRFVLMVMKMCIVHLFRRLHIRSTEETKKPLEYYSGQITLQPKKIVIKLEKRF